MSSYENATNSRAIEFASIRLTALVPAAAGHKIGAPSADLGGANRQRRDLLTNRVGLPALRVASLRAEFGRRLGRNGICRKRRKRVDPHENGPQLGIEMSSGARARAGEVIE
jgi:hypothetical protein